MSKFVKIIWTVTSYAPLMLVCGIALFVDSLTIKQITGDLWIGCVVFAIGVVCIPICFGLLALAKKSLPKSKLVINATSPGDTNSLSSMIAYLLPVVTLSITDINLWVLCAMIFIIILMLLWTKAIFVNPLVYLFGYRYYDIQASSGMSYTLLSRQKRFNPKAVEMVIELFDEMYLEV
ncbi:MAG: hypothetical protein OSJ39_00265 [Clostridia bacterium]|nr:hypothetical protein [Clostridia bacterium]